VKRLSQSKITLIIGGCRSGKSEYAEQLAYEAKGPVYYLATGVVTDEEMERRVEQHQLRRPAHWETIEEPLHPEQAVARLKDRQGVLLVDSLSGWVTNLLYDNNLINWQWDQAKEDQALALIRAFIGELQQSSLHALIVGDEVGLSLVPPTAEGRAFRDLNGKANQLVAAAADQVYLVVAGLPVKIK
jgi:adenosylcobinamide kinase/adenosylcobinamide-phosphate guanylyltransferase